MGIGDVMRPHASVTCRDQVRLSFLDMQLMTRNIRRVYLLKNCTGEAVP
jgi:hypothetical protein